jgi:type II secretory pathway pseudopilin PulG
MGTKTNTGFTIIETMLFFAVAGVLTAAIFAGSSASINQQRYKESVNSLKSFIQQQYSETTNASNDRAGSESCSANAVVLQAPGSGASQARGTSECILLGRLIAIDGTGTKLTASNVVGYRTPGAPEAISDILELKTNYKLGISTLGQEKSEVAWSAVVVKKQSTQPTAVSILILRSPLSGSIMTYTSQTAVSNLQTMIAVANSNKSTELCVNPASGTLQDRRMAVQISPFASSQGAIQVPTESSNVCD